MDDCQRLLEYMPESEAGKVVFFVHIMLSEQPLLLLGQSRGQFFLRSVPRLPRHNKLFVRWENEQRRGYFDA